MSEQVNNERVTISRGDRLNVNWRTTFVQANWNYERMHNVGFAYIMAPIIRKLYKTDEDRRAALERHLEFVNTHPYLHSPIVGVVLALEEERANGAPIDDMAIQGVKIGMMGPLAGVGDPIFWGTLRPVIGAFAASLALSESVLGPILFFLLWNIIRVAFMWYSQELGYRAGSEITKELSGGILQKLTTGASILGMFVMGVLVPRWTTMNFPMVISQIQNDPDSIVDFEGLAEMANNNTVTVDKLREIVTNLAGGANITETTTQTLGNVFNSLLPGLMPLILTLIAMYLMKERNVKPITLIFAIFVLGIAMYALGVMG